MKKQFLKSTFFATCIGVSFSANAAQRARSPLPHILNQETEENNKVQSNILMQNCLQKITNIAIANSLECIARPFAYEASSELINISNLICANFVKRREWYILKDDIKAIYSQANTPEALYETMRKPDTSGFILEDRNFLLGTIIMRPNEYPDGSCALQIRRLHVNFEAMNYKGIGKSLLTIAAAVALSKNIKTLMTTASIPARGFFEKLGWKGHVIHTSYSTPEQKVVLPQFQCSYQISNDFQGF